MHLKAQEGPQREFLSSPADLVIYGGAAGGGKTYAMLMEPLRHIHNPQFGAVIFRRTSPQITNEGGMWDVSGSIYSKLGAKSNQQRLSWKFHSGSTVTFASMQHEDDRFQWDGSQIPLIGFDQLEHFTWKQFTYMFSRNRTTCGVKPYVRATCNPDPDHWLREFLDWWINEDTGLPIAERSGKTRYMIIIDDIVRWGDSQEDLQKIYGDDVLAKSVCFISSKVTDNKILLKNDPGYLTNLQALPRIERERLEMGNWNIRATAGNFFREEWFDIVDHAPRDGVAMRGWDLAATEDDPTAAWTAGVKMIHGKDGYYYIVDVKKEQATPGGVERLILRTATQDSKNTKISLPQDPGQAGLSQKRTYSKLLMGFNFTFSPESGSKEERAMPLSAQAEAGNVKIVRGKWNDSFLKEAVAFPDGKFKDQIDGASRAFGEFSKHTRQSVPVAPTTIELETAIHA